MSLELPVAWDRASGFQVEDSAGNRWLDFTSGIFVANVGHAHPRVREAIVEMAQRPLLHSYSFPTEVRARLVEKLVAVTPAQLDTVVLLTTGSEANEVVIKLARLNGLRTDPGKLGIISLTFGFHGKTMGAQTASGRPEAKRWIGRLDPNFHQLPAPYAPLCPWDHNRGQPCGAACFKRGMESLQDAGVDLGTVAAFLVEPFQGWSAAFLPDDYVHAMRAWADAHGALLCFDEVQSGIGRTGRFFAHEHFGVEADLVSCGKGISSSLPVSAVLGPRNLVDVDDSLHSTHGANPVCCAAALANLEILAEEHLLAAAVSAGEVLGPRLRQVADRSNGHVSRVEGRGMVWALHLTDPATGELDSVLGDMVIERAMRKGVLLVRTGTGTIKVGPPLGIPLDAAMEGVEVIEEALVEALAERSPLKR
jgi:4-aminobutyrate aminotransferase/(S)-3-amino-2-methylpropionate transaminase